MKTFKLLFLFLAIVCLVFSITPSSGGLLDDDPFLNEEGLPVWARDMETLVYRVSFFGIPAGYAEFQYVGEEVEDGKTLYHVRMKAWTTGLVKFFKEIRDVFDFYIDAETLLPFKVVSRKNESGKVKNKIVRYIQDEGVLRYFTLEGKFTHERRVVPRVFEPVTVAYYLRTKNLLYDDVNVRVYGGKKLYTLKVEVLGKEKVKTEIGIFDTIKIKPVLIREDGEDKKGKDVVAWLMDDGSNIPVLVHAKLKVGTLTGELVKMVRGD